MVHKRVVEAFLDRLGVGRELVVRQVELGDDLAVHHAVDERPELGILHHLTHRLHAGEPGQQRHHGVRTIEKEHLALAVRGHVVGDDDVEPGLGERQTLGELLWALDDPEQKRLGLHDEIVRVPELDGELCCAVFRVAGNDPVDQAGEEHVLVGHPAGERLPQVPQLGKLQHNLAQTVAVVLDELARDDLESGLAQLEAAVEQGGQFAREALLRSIREGIGVGELDAGFGGVGEDELDVVVLGESEVGGVVGIGINRARHHGDDLVALHLFAVELALEQHRVEVVLGTLQCDESAGEGLHNRDTAVEEALVVHLLQLPFDKPAQKVALAELDGTCGQSGVRQDR